jgi:hypothetical protein
MGYAQSNRDELFIKDITARAERERRALWRQVWLLKDGAGRTMKVCGSYSTAEEYLRLRDGHGINGWRIEREPRLLSDRECREAIAEVLESVARTMRSGPSQRQSPNAGRVKRAQGRDGRRSSRPWWQCQSVHCRT